MSDGEINVDSIDGEVSTSANIVGELYPKGEKGDKGDPGNDGFSPTVTTEKVGKTTTITITDAEGEHTATILDGADGQGSGDMRTEVYDVNQNGIVDNAEKVNNHTVGTDVPADAVFTDTTYTAGTGIDITGNVITNTQTSAEWGNITGTLSDQTDLKNALDSKANTSAVPTKVSDLNNDSGFIDKDVNNLTNYDTSTTVDTKISNSEEVLIGSDSGIKASHELWVDTSDVTPYINSEISNDYGTAQNLGYSQNYVNGQIGSLSNLTTTAKTNIVSAVNELDSKAKGTTTISELSVENIKDVKHIDYNGTKKTATEENKYLKIATIEFSENWKASNMFFTLTNVQSDSYLQLVNLYCHKTGTGVEISHFSTIGLRGDVKQNLVAIVTATNKVELYFKNLFADSTALNIIAEPKLYCRVTIDMDTIVTTLPSGTTTYVTDTTVENSKKWDGLTRDTATENNIDTWIPVIKDDKFQHTTINSIVSRGIKSKNVSGTPDSNGFIAAGLGLNNIVIGVSNASSSGTFFTPFISTQENRITIKCEAWNRQPITNSISFTVHYIEI